MISVVSSFRISLHAAMIGLVVLALPAMAAVHATITFRDGQTTSGQYLGGTEETVRVQKQTPQGPEIVEFPVTEILSIVFGEATSNDPTVRDSSLLGRKVGMAELVPVGTAIKVKLGQPLSTTLSQAGSTFMAIVAEDVSIAETVLIRKGLAVVGRVAAVKPGGRVKGEPQLSLVLDSLHLPSGSLPLKTRVWIEPGSSGVDPGVTASPFLTLDNQISLPVGTKLEFILVQSIGIPEL